MKLFNTLTRKKEEFEPFDSGNVRMYTCGPTVYSEIHIGNFRTYMTTDVLRRTLQYAGYKTTAVMNITDVGHFRFSSATGKQIDPVIEESKRLNITPLELSQQYADLFLKDAQKLNILPSDVYPKASDHVKEMIEMIEILVEKGFAYTTAEGDVYFDVDKFKEYGKLSGNTLDKMDTLLEAVRVSTETDKKDSVDFALWKAKGDRVLEWDSPWGKGVPGWHIECSAMAIKYLGLQFDLHAGGEDLVFPHHEDEIAQAEATTGMQFVKYWLHARYLTIEGEKMSKSKGNVYTLSELRMRGYNPLAYRYLTFLTHYSTRMNMTWKSLDAAQAALENLYEKASEMGEPARDYDAKYEHRFFDAVTDDLDMPKAVSTMWSMLRSPKLSNAIKAATLYKIDEVLGFNIQKTAQRLTNIPEEIKEMVADRVKLRKLKKYHLADQLRAKIEKKGYVIDDTKKGSRVLRKI